MTAVVTSTVKLLVPAKPTMSRRATAFSIDAIMASECRKSNDVTNDISGSAAAVASSSSSPISVTSPPARKSTESG